MNANGSVQVVSCPNLVQSGMLSQKELDIVLLYVRFARKYRLPLGMEFDHASLRLTWCGRWHTCAYYLSLGLLGYIAIHSNHHAYAHT